ncbi:hypothetical protein FEM48_Zijuj01G0126400 [Ziziphus jujuba var. spinosa]|uniref:Homeodomain-like superfamily protein n=1 Tax=Ziziphus jujuba var. spinosa TaxID=714518 RepID=A0A978W1B1_ZIZJJ|nr:hypothetical protein FEM48_Zijuj01G0126400 [Ziziphus jujuba var. spinosa]
MASCSNPQSTKLGYLSNHSALPSITNLSECNESSTKPDEEEEEDEEEDIDFNPFLKETPSPEASSSLSSEIEGLDAVDCGKNIIGTVGVDSSELTCEVQNCAGDPDHGEEEVVMQTVASSEGTFEKEFPNNSTRDLKKRVSTLLSPTEGEIVQEKGNFSSSGIGVNDVRAGESGATTDSQERMIVLDNEDAICRRTRARYSLASFTLDELETFLQETDDEDDLQNVDDEEEYRKFLAAVLLGGDSGGQSTQENEIADDDEDNDADFEIELEEALESDVDERRDKTEEDYEISGRRPETRQNSRKKSSSHCKKKFLAQTRRPLRPLLPVFPNGPISSFSTQDGKTFMPETVSNCLSSRAQDGYINGFTPHQIGQLHCLIHEHVQLLIQVFSLCAFDSSRLHIASQVQKLIFEMLHKRNEVLAWKSVSYPSSCFCTPYIFSSVPNDVPKFFPTQCISESSPSYTANEMCSTNNQASTSENVSPSKGTCDSTSKSQAGSFRNVEGSFWMPYISGPVLTILDAAPLSLVGNYMNEVENAVQESRRRHVESSCDTRFEREPLFPLPSFPSVSQSNCEGSSRTASSAINTVSPPSSQQPPKKTLAATLVENTKKQSVALVPREISKLSQRFFPLFNPALFPHKPPPAAHANRVLFTDAEDELLALGLMEYNTDWKAIQQRFLPCKSKHQIFVRQKNRCSSKAPENPIKAVRRMKTSPLTTEELACIQEGLRVFKYNWMSVWQFVVPHRDPSLLPRQWRVALGTQKSYKLDAAKREKRRLYESKRRKCKIADSSIWQNKEDCHAENSGGENNTADDYIDNSGKTYVHEAFLADWRPNTNNGHAHGAMLSQEQLNNYRPGEVPQSQISNVQQFPSLSKNPRHPSFHSIGVKESGPSTTLVNNSVSSKSLGTSKSQFHLRPYRARRTNGAHLVKLAPDLPPVNLPPSARILPQSAFKGSLSGAASVISAHGSGIGDAATQNIVSRIPHDGSSGITHAVKYRQENSNLMKDSLTSFHAQESRIVKDKCTEEERNIDSDLQMHPLLFQTPEDGQQPCYPLNYNTTNSSSFSFFSGNQPQLNLSLLHNPHQENHVGSCTTSLKSSTSRGIDFHPLLQRTDYLNSDSVSACSTAQLSVSSGGKYNQLHSSFDAGQNKSLIDGNQLARGLHPSSDERGKELDLEIQLSSTSRKGKARGRDVTHNSVKSIINAADSGGAPEAQDNSSLLYQHAENSPSNSHMLVSGGHTLVVPSNNSGRYVDDMADQSLPEIVMEQEELSDSDEENEENVEFECEEMADSEAEEGSGCEQIAEVKAKNAPRADCGDKQCESRTDDFNSQGTVHIPGKEIPSLELGLTSQAKDAACKPSWLSLHSSVPDHPSHMLRKHDGSLIGEGDATKNLASCRPSRSCKKTKPSTKEVTTQKQALNMEHQLSLGPLAIPIMRKPRKHACRNNTSSTID